jgi:hypothetical protein
MYSPEWRGRVPAFALYARPCGGPTIVAAFALDTSRLQRMGQGIVCKMLLRKRVQLAAQRMRRNSLSVRARSFSNFDRLDSLRRRSAD